MTAPNRLFCTVSLKALRHLSSLTTILGLSSDIVRASCAMHRIWEGGGREGGGRGREGGGREGDREREGEREL